MAESGLFDFEVAYDRLDKEKGIKDPLLELDGKTDWEVFSGPLAAFRSARNKKQETGRKPFDAILMFKILIVQSLYNLSDEAMEFQIRDRLSFQRFLGLGFADRVPDARTIWRFRDELASAGMVEVLFKQFDDHLREKGLLAYGGQMIDASIVKVPTQRNTRDENEKIKGGEVPEGWSEKKRRHKDTDADWTKKNAKVFYGYKNHIEADVGHKLIRDYEVTPASVHDSQVFMELLDPLNTNKSVYADSAYRSAALFLLLSLLGYREKIQRKGSRNHPLTGREKQGNRTRAKIRCRVEHIFGMQAQRAGKLVVRAIGYVRAKASIGLRNLAYNLTRAVWLGKNGGHCCVR